MTLLDAIISTGGALQRHKLRSCLTALGIIIGTSATITMMAVGAGAREQVAAQVRSLGTNLMIVMPGNANQSGVRLGAGAAPSLTDEDTAAVPISYVPARQGQHARGALPRDRHRACS